MISREYYRYLCDCSNFAIVGSDCAGQIISWNHAAQELFHAPAAEMVGQPIARIVPEERRSTLQEAVDRAVKERKNSEFEVRHRVGDGSTKVLAVVITPVEDENGDLLGVAGWIRDISNRKLLEQQLTHSEKMASLGTLASGVAHHFNNIIGGVATFVDFALTSQDPEAAQRALKMTAEAATRISKITSSLLTFAQKGVRSTDLSDLTEVILTFSHLVEKPLSEKNITLDLHLQAVPIYEVSGTRIHQILGHLLDNSERAMNKGGTVTIDLHPRDNDLIMKFSDTGAGIEPADLPHIFEPFYTTEGVVSGGDYPSSGLGLAVVHGIVRELGASITVESQVGKGTTFTINFPEK